MSPPPDGWIGASLTVLVGALTGGLTNRVAIWMLFHPYEPPRLGPLTLRWLQGALPKNQERLARKIGQTVGTHLLRPEDVVAELQRAGLRRTFEERLETLLGELLDRRHPSLRELLPDSALGEVRSALASLLEGLEARLLASLSAPEFGDRAEGWLAGLADALSEAGAEPFAPERLERLRGRVDEWLAELAGSEALEGMLRRQLMEAAGEVLRPGRSFEEVIPPGLVAALEHAINDYIPLAMERLGRLLEDPLARDRVERAVHELLERFMRDLRFHQRVVAKLIITEDTVEKVIDTLEREGAERLGSLLREEEVQRAIARNVNEAIVDFLRRPVTEVLGEADDPQVREALASVAAWGTRRARDPRVRAFVLERAEQSLSRLGGRSWEELAALVPADRLGPWLATALRSGAGRSVLARLETAAVDAILGRPIGVPGRLLRDDAARRVGAELAPRAWEWIVGELPAVAERVRVADRVEQRILEFPLPRLEEIVRSVTEHELELIVRLGYLLGAFIGVLLVAVQWLLA